MTINTSGLSFSTTDSSTRYAVVIRAGSSPDAPMDRYTCYTGITTRLYHSKRCGNIRCNSALYYPYHRKW
jgi:hypothetical protein